MGRDLALPKLAVGDETTTSMIAEGQLAEGPRRARFRTRKR